LCGESPKLGSFLGQYTDDAEAGADAWRWVFDAGQVVFSTRPSIALDESTAVLYCSSCGQDMRQERELAPETPIFVNLLNN
jgi:hypothetical protein